MGTIGRATARTNRALARGREPHCHICETNKAGQEEGGQIMQFHPVASIFPMMSVEEFKALKESIGARGQRNPIYTHEGKIVDGRNRYQACVELGIHPRFEQWDGVGLLCDFVWDMNAGRRQLTGGALQIAAGTYAI